MTFLLKEGNHIVGHFKKESTGLYANTFSKLILITHSMVKGT